MVTKNTGLQQKEPINLTRPKVRKQFDGLVDGDILIVGTSVYEGSIPTMILKPLNKLKGEGKWAVPIAVYGTRSPEACLEEMSGLLRTRGFKILAAANFVAEHSYAHDEAPAGRGRPNEEDLKIAADFGKKIVEKLNTSPLEIAIESKPLKHGENYMREERSENRVKRVINAPDLDEDKCIKCNKCVDACPMAATDPETYSIACPMAATDPETYSIDDEECMRCMVCVRVCPTNAKTITFPARVAEFMNKWEGKKIPEIFV
jgi:formate hydrogenlyase subunit 6/NADH:ubiquinone oxidoreductase subunit I